MPIIPLEQQIIKLPKSDRKQYLIDKIKYYRSGPDGCLSYIDEVIRYPNPMGGSDPIQLWDIQRRMIYEIVDFLFDMDRQFYILLGSRQCSKTFSLNLIIDYLMTLYSNYPIVLLHADATRAARTLTDYRNQIYDTKSPIMKCNTKINRSMMLSYQNNSRIMAIPTQKSSKQADTGRSLTSNLLWIDEAAFVDLVKLESSIFPVTSQAFIQCKKNNLPFGIVLTSSANGRIGIGKRYYEYWKKAEENMTDGISSRGDVSGFKLHYSMVPNKDDKWKKSLLAIITERSFNQEYECVFYGGESTFFSDNTIKAIQDRVIELTTIYQKNPIYEDNFVGSSATVFKTSIYKEINPGDAYIIGIDVSKGSSMDYHVIEVFDFSTMDQVMECKDNNSSITEFTELVNHIVELLLTKRARLAIALENNMGFAMISELFKSNDMYKMLIYKDTISEDFKAKKSTTKIDYGDCKFGLATTALTRPFIIDLIWRFVNNNYNCLNSIYLLNEIESLESKDGKIEGAVHDDAVFALGMLLLMKNKGRINNLMAIFDSCEDLWPDDINDNSCGLKHNHHPVICDSGIPELKDPIIGLDINAAIGYIGSQKIVTNMAMNYSNNLNADMASQLSMQYNNAVVDLSNPNNYGNNKFATINDCKSRNETFEPMNSSDSYIHDVNEVEKQYSNNWGKMVAFDD